MKKRQINLFAGISLFILLFGVQAFAQSVWLDLKPLPSWNERKRAILQTKKISNDELKRCAGAVRQPTLAQDQLLTKMGWTLVGPAHVFGKITVITTAEAFDGMCRPLRYDSYVFVGNRVAGALSPGQMDSRTDGSLVNVKMTTEKTLTAEYVRYNASDALCYPSKTEAVTFVIKPDTNANFLLVPESKIDTSAGDGNQQGTADALKNTIWRWESAENFEGKVTIDKPENYELEFTADGRLRAQVDCNRGSGTYNAAANSLTLSAVATTRRACPPGSLDSRFLQGLSNTRTFRIEGNTLILEGAVDNAAMRFFRVSKQN